MLGGGPGPGDQGSGRGGEPTPPTDKGEGRSATAGARQDVRCCIPLAFEYPLPGTAKWHSAKAEQPTFEFKVHAEFNPGGAGSSDCACACCEFVQLVLADKLAWDGVTHSSLDPVEGGTRAQGPWAEQEDCVYIAVVIDETTGKRRAVGGMPGPPIPNQRTRQWIDAVERTGATVVGPVCIGEHGAHPLSKDDERYADPGTDTRGHYSKGDCEYDLTDRPSHQWVVPREEAMPSGGFTWKWKSEGLIIDVCPKHRNEVVASRVWEVEWKGAMTVGMVTEMHDTPTDRWEVGTTARGTRTHYERVREPH